MKSTITVRVFPLQLSYSITATNTWQPSMVNVSIHSALHVTLHNDTFWCSVVVTFRTYSIPLHVHYQVHCIVDSLKSYNFFSRDWLLIVEHYQMKPLQVIKVNQTAVPIFQIWIWLIIAITTTVFPIPIFIRLSSMSLHRSFRLVIIVLILIDIISYNNFLFLVFFYSIQFHVYPTNYQSLFSWCRYY